MSRASGEANHGYIGGVAGGVGRVDGHRGNRKLVGIDTSSAGTVQRNVLEGGTHTGYRCGVCGDPSITADGSRRSVGAETVGMGINHFRTIRYGGPAHVEGTTHIHIPASART